LTGTGLAGVVLHELAYPVTMSPDDYLAMLDVFLYGRVVRYRLGAARWRAFKKRVAEKLHAREVTRVEYIARFHLGVGRRPEQHRDAAPIELRAKRPKVGRSPYRCLAEKRQDLSFDIQTIWIPTIDRPAEERVGRA